MVDAGELELQQFRASVNKSPALDDEPLPTLPEDVSQAIRDNGRARVEQWLDSLRSAERSHVVDLGKRYFPYIGKANALHLAVWYNKEDIAKLLIEYGADPNCVTSKGHAAIHLACSSKFCSKEIVLLLVNNEAVHTMRTRIHQRTPLLIAAFKGKTEVVKFLLDQVRQNGGAAELHKHIHIQDTDGNSALQMAVFARSCEIIDLLLQSGADPNLASPNGQTALHVAASKENPDIVNSLLKKGANVHLQDEEGETALHVGIFAGCSSTVALLLDAGADPNQVSAKRKKAPLQLAAARRKPEIVKYLLTKGANVHGQDEDGETALHEAVQAGCYDAVTVLLDADADPNCVTLEGCAPLHLTCSSDYGLDIMRLLVERGAKYNIRNRVDKRSALHLAALNGKPELVKYLFDQGATLQLDISKNTPLHLAARAPGAVQVMEMLHEAGAKSEAKNANKETPFAIACRYGYRENIGYLLQSCRTEDLRLAIEAGYSDEARELVRSKRWFEMLTQTYTVNDTETTPFRELVKSMPDVAEDVLNQCVLYTPDINQGSTEFGVKFVYEFIDDFQNEGNAVGECRSGPPSYCDLPSSGTVPFSTSWGPRTFSKANHPLQIMVDKQRDNLLQHPVVLSLVHYKWKKFGQYVFFANLLSYCVFLAFLTCFILVVPAPQSATCEAVFNRSVSREQNSSGVNCNTSPGTTGFLYFAAVVIILCAVVRLASELTQLLGLHAQNWKLYVLDWTNWMEVILFCFSILFVWVFHTECLCPFDWQWQIGVVALFLAWMTFIILLSKFPVLGIYVLMFLKVFYTFLKILVLAFFLVISFGLVFHALLLEPEFTRSPFSTPLRSLFKTMALSTGELEFDSFFRLSTNGDSDEAEPLRFAVVTYILWVVFVVLMPILLLNLLTGLAVDDIQQIQKVASRRKLELQVSLALTVEEYLNRIYAQYRTRHIVGVLCFFPNAVLPVKPSEASDPSHVRSHTKLRSLFWNLSLFLWGGEVYYDLEKVQRIRQTKEGYVSAQEKGQQLAILKHSTKTSVEAQTHDIAASIKGDIEETNEKLTGIAEATARLTDSTERRLSDIEQSVKLIAERSVQSEKSIDEIKHKLELLIDRLAQCPDEISL